MRRRLVSAARRHASAPVLREDDRRRTERYRIVLPPETLRCRRHLYTARLTLDITPAMRSRIKVSAFTQGVTVADLLRALLEREFPENKP